MDIHVRTTTFEICALPPGDRDARQFTLTAKVNAAGEWVVTDGVRFCSRTGEWSHRPDHPAELATWKEDHHFPTYLKAIFVARAAAPLYTVNGFRYDGTRAPR